MIYYSPLQRAGFLTLSHQISNKNSGEDSNIQIIADSPLGQSLDDMSDQLYKYEDNEECSPHNWKTTQSKAPQPVTQVKGEAGEGLIPNAAGFLLYLQGHCPF